MRLNRDPGDPSFYKQDGMFIGEVCLSEFPYFIIKERSGSISLEIEGNYFRGKEAWACIQEWYQIKYGPMDKLPLYINTKHFQKELAERFKNG